MKVLTVRNVEEALLIGMKAIDQEGKPRDSRNGPVRVFSTPVTTQYLSPKERVIFLPERDANPYFHFMESLWMMAGRNDVEWISQFNNTIANYSDDGVIFHGAYGHRWRNMSLSGIIDYDIGVLDQLSTIANLLKKNPDDRRTVLQMWDAPRDLGLEGKDFPCNLTCTFRINPRGKLDMTVFNRSNDMIWGAYGANAVHFSVLQEVIAAWVGVPVGMYWQISTNFHAYDTTFDKLTPLLDKSLGFTPYELGDVAPFPIVNTPIDNWFGELDMFMSEGPVIGFKDPFFTKVVFPMWFSWRCWKEKQYDLAIANAQDIQASDWRKACVEWLERRISSAT